MEQLIVGKSLEMQLATVLNTLPPAVTVSYMVTRLNEGEEATIVASSKETIVHTGASNGENADFGVCISLSSTRAA